MTKKLHRPRKVYKGGPIPLKQSLDMGDLKFPLWAGISPWQWLRLERAKLR